MTAKEQSACSSSSTVSASGRRRLSSIWPPPTQPIAAPLNDRSSTEVGIIRCDKDQLAGELPAGMAVYRMGDVDAEGGSAGAARAPDMAARLDVDRVRGTTRVHPSGSAAPIDVPLAHGSTSSESRVGAP